MTSSSPSPPTVSGSAADEGEQHPGTCAGCGDRITDRYYLLAVEKRFHVTCLVCVVCRLPLDSEVTCFAKDGDIYCKEDYYRRFVLKCCAHCRLSIGADELVMRVRDHIYHLSCFSCAVCGKQLTTGEQFALSDTLIFCQPHYESLLLHGDLVYRGGGPPGPTDNHHHHQPPPPRGPFQDSGGGGIPLLPSHPLVEGYFSQHSVAAAAASVVVGHGGSLQKGRPRKRKSAMAEAEHFVPTLGSDMTNLSHDEIMLQHPRQKRMRTSFKHHQLRIMKSYFALNHNPDSKDLKQLAQKTGLSKRVLQVWFQNARAKHRRTAMKERDKQPGAQGGPEGLGGVSGGGGGLLEIQTMSGGGGGGGGLRKGAPASSLMNELSNSGSQGALSDISSSTSLMGLRGGGSALDHDLTTPGSALSDIFGSTLRSH